MGYSVVTCNEVKVSELSLSQIYRLFRDCEVLIDIARKSPEISANQDMENCESTYYR